jgi:RNA polymerase sigma-70 factor (ECF subfamily)
MTALYERYAPTILSYLRRHVSSDEDAEDLLLEVFLAVLENANFWALDEASQLAWLRRVAHNKYIDLYRKNSRRPVQSLEKMMETTPFYDESSGAPELSALRGEEYMLLREHLARLPEQYQEIIRLRFGAAMRCVEIARKLQVPEGTVRGWLSRALNHLRSIYQQHPH